MNELTLMKARHSVRTYTDKKIEPAKRKKLVEKINSINEDSGLHIQVFFDEPECFTSKLSKYGKFTGVNNYFALVGPKNKDLEEDCGYYGEQLVLFAQSIGLNTCWVAMTHGKSKAVIENGEKLVCLIALGYGKDNGSEHSTKTIYEVSNVREESPAWFKNGIEAALLAPTAMNQQKFRFVLYDLNNISLQIDGFGFYTKLDLGIVKYHFETVSGKRVNVKNLVHSVDKEINNLSSELTDSQKVLSALGDENRLHIISQILKLGKCNGVRVNDITETTDLSRPAVSHHLAILKDAGILAIRKEGTKNYYYFNTDQSELKQVITTLNHAVKISESLRN